MQRKIFKDTHEETTASEKNQKYSKIMNTAILSVCVKNSIS